MMSEGKEEGEVENAWDRYNIPDSTLPTNSLSA